MNIKEANLEQIINFYTTIGVKGIDDMTEIDNRLSWEIPLLEETFQSNSKLLDVGCGQGRISLILSKKNYKITGIDIVQNFIDYANKTAKSKDLDATFYCDNFQNLDKYDFKIDGAFCMWGTIRHILNIDEQVDLLKKVYTHLSNKGKFLIDTIDENNLEHASNIDNKYQNREVIKVGNESFIKVNHKKMGLYTVSCSFNEESLKEIFVKAGFKNLERKYIDKDKSRLVIIGQKIGY